MKYLLMIYGNEEIFGAVPDDVFQQVIRDTNALQQELRESGEWICAYGVTDQVNAKTVSVRDGVAAVTDGPYLEAKEYLGSFDIIDCESLERALEIAARVPWARVGEVEVRPLMAEGGAEM
jgi:hypothetical protein